MEWEESIVVPLVSMKRVIKQIVLIVDIYLFVNYKKILSSILLSRLTPHAEKIIGYHQCGFRRNRSTTDHISCIRHVLEIKWEHNEALHHLVMDFNKCYDSVRREVLYNILIEFGIPMKPVRLMKMCLNETHSRVWVRQTFVRHVSY